MIENTTIHPVKRRDAFQGEYIYPQEAYRPRRGTVSGGRVSREVVPLGQILAAGGPPPPYRPVLVEIPARSGSKRVRDKNIRLLNGIPLMAYTILVARNTPGVDRVVVNTDSERYADIAREFGAEVPFLRPAEIASDTTSMGTVAQHFTEFMLREYDRWCRVDVPFVKHVQLCPTTPFRNVNTIAGYVRSMGKYSMVGTAVRGDVEPEKLYLGEDERFMGDYMSRRCNRKFFYKNRSNFTGRTIPNLNRTQKIVLLDNPIEMIDIDTEEDFALAEDVVRNGLYDFGMTI